MTTHFNVEGASYVNPDEPWLLCGIAWELLEDGNDHSTYLEQVTCPTCRRVASLVVAHAVEAQRRKLS